MKPHRHSRLSSLDGVQADPPAGLFGGPLRAALEPAIARTRNWLVEQQQTDGHWVAELEGDTILESEYILLLAFLGQHRSSTARKAAQYLLDKQTPEGGWSPYPGGPMDISASVKAYFALKLTDHDPESRPMARARAAILTRGGAGMVNSFTRFYLALLGQISYDHCPAVPPEIVLLPQWAPVNLSKVSAWTRTIIVPLSIMWACRPKVSLDPKLGISELFLSPPHEWPPLRCPGHEAATHALSWDPFFRMVDRMFKWLERSGWRPLRKKALATAQKWMVDRFEGSDGLGAIFPPMIWSVIALRCLDYRADSREMIYCLEQLKRLVIEDERTVRLQPCKSPVWDTAIALRALSVAGLGSQHQAAKRAVDWLLDQQIERRGDCCQALKIEPGGWCFEYANAFYPDIDDTAMVVMALESQVASANVGGQARDGLMLLDQTAVTSANEARKRVATLDRLARATSRAINWVAAMQNRDGGWGAFDRDNDHEFLCHVPFADHNAMIDPSTPDLTGRVLEMFGELGRGVGDPLVDRAVAYMRRTQNSDGSWFGRWGVNYIYGTWQSLAGLAAVGLGADDPAMAAGANWLLACQQPSGAWGESPESYARPELRGRGPATASQTAWALLGLIAAGQAGSHAALRGVGYLLSTQRNDGTWAETEFTGTGFPQVFYLRYHYYPIYFPLLALARWAAAADGPMASAKDRAGSLTAAEVRAASARMES
jgi:squalene-hopene/tetraprenyl-beta-curcumene cyclase